MIVYGDPSTQESFRSLVERLKESLSAARPGSLDDARAVLIQAGMLEQAVEDALPEGVAPCRRLTDAAAGHFVDAWADSQRRPSPCGAVNRPTDREDALAKIPRVDAVLTVKQPEGFAFYALCPESYASAALSWLEAHRGLSGDDPAPVVVGVRSIGTTLSAVVAATLRAEGLAAGRVTLRPTGHPFARKASLTDPLGVWLVSHASHALIVDEGPGLSGSSMAAAAEAVLDAGIPRERIAFLPGHAHDPGGMASDEVRRWWRETPRVVVPTEALRWEGRTLDETLLHASEGGVAIEELTGGRWRARAYADEAEWPPVALPFERRKLLVTRADGSAILYKFVGLSEPGTLLGFAPAPWIDGRPLTPADADPELLAQLARHIAAVAGPPLSPPEAEAARERLTHMLRHNAEEAGMPPLRVARLGEGAGGEANSLPWGGAGVGLRPPATTASPPTSGGASRKAPSSRPTDAPPAATTP